MDRPTLNPSITPDDPQPARAQSWKVFFAKAWLRNALRLAWRMITYNPLKGAPVQIRIEDGTFWQRVFRGLCYRMAFVPIIAALCAVSLVWSATHPPNVAISLDPSSEGIYYDPVSFLSDDGTRLEGWLVPVLEPKQVLAQKDLSLRARRPAVVLLHDHGQSRQQMMPLIQPLHEAGFVVLALGLRGRGAAESAGATFGLREAADAKAAVELLRRRTFVDGTKIAVVGVGTGANAALIAADEDRNIAAVVAVSPHDSAKEVLTSVLGPKQRWLAFLDPLCKWTFELAYQVDIDELSLSRYSKLTAERPVLITQAGPIAQLGTKHTREICAFLDSKIPTTIVSAGDK